MNNDFFDENDTFVEMVEKIVASCIYNGFEHTSIKIFEEVKIAYNKPIKLDHEKIIKDTIDECLRKSPKVSGEGHEYIIRGNLNTGECERVEITGEKLSFINTEITQKLFDKIDKEKNE